MEIAVWTTVLFGFIVALPFCSISNYYLRIIVCMVAPSLILRIMIAYAGHLGDWRDYGVGDLVMALGGLLAAHVRTLLEYIKRKPES
jgi:hypothetical protein